MQKLVTFLMFEGRAEEAIQFYLGLFPGSSIKSIERYGNEMPGKEGTVKLANILLAGQEFMLTDTPVKHNFGFTPSVSIYVNCDSEQEIDTLFPKLADGGRILMGLGPYPFSKKFGWTDDKFGVSWQLSIGR